MVLSGVSWIITSIGAPGSIARVVDDDPMCRQMTMPSPEHAVAVHVVDALVDVPAALADAGECRRLDAVLLGWLARDRVQADVGDLAALVQPGVRSVGAVRELRRVLHPLVGKVPLEQVG